MDNGKRELKINISVSTASIIKYNFIYEYLEEYVEGYIEALLIQIAVINSLLFGKDLKQISYRVYRLLTLRCRYEYFQIHAAD